MPRYDWKCKDCGETDFKIIPMSEYDDLKVEPCKKCEGVMQREFFINYRKTQSLKGRYNSTYDGYKQLADEQKD